MTRALLLAVTIAFLVACSEDSSSETTTTGTAARTMKVYFLRDGRVWPVARQISGDALNVLDALEKGPNERERSLGLTSEVPKAQRSHLSRAGLAQLVYTLTQAGMSHSAEVGGVEHTRADFEDQTPLILVESPLPFEEVTTPLRVTGTANTFEATFQYELVDSAGKVVDKNFVTATSGTGTRGTFDFTTKKVDDVAALRVFELSAEDGSRIHEAEIPLRMSQ